MDPSCSYFILFENDFDDLQDSLKKLNLKDAEYIFIPINDSTGTDKCNGSHWALLLYNSKSDSFFYYDSLNRFI